MEILSTSQMYAADKATAKIVPELQLMENAGFATACEISKTFHKCPVFVLCGSGNNGGDGFVIARTLKKWGWPVEVIFAGDITRMKGSVLHNAKKWDGTTVLPSSTLVSRIRSKKGIVVDALFGIGLSKPLPKNIAALFDELNASDTPCVAVDIPSGVQADTGALLNTALKCQMTVTFCRPKVGHFLYPGKEYAGTVLVRPIGITDQVVQEQNPTTFINSPELFQIPEATYSSHKYTQGAVLINGGKMTGAARLAALACRRAGAGWVKITCPQELFSIYSADMPGTLVTPIETADDFTAQVNDPKIKSVVIGMGNGITEETETRLKIVSESGKSFVVDADALSYAKEMNISNAVLTPHEGEFRRLFPELNEEGKLARAMIAANRLNCTVVFKGADTIIATADGFSAITPETNFGMATAGSGDVLAGIIGAMLAKGMPPFEAACAGVWLHTQAAISAGTHIIAEDIIDYLG